MSIFVICTEILKKSYLLARTCEVFTSTFNCTSLVTKSKKERRKKKEKRKVDKGRGGGGGGMVWEEGIKRKKSGEGKKRKGGKGEKKKGGGKRKIGENERI